MPSVRDAFFREVYQYLRQGEDLVVVSADLGAPSLDALRADFGDRFINVGIAEQNLVAVAAGLALAGKRVIAYGLNPFLCTRALDQIRNLMESMRIPITLAALNAGTCSAEAGYTHMAIEATSLLRPLRGVRLATPTDETLAARCAAEAALGRAPQYVQFDKQLGGKRYTPEEIQWAEGFVCTRGHAALALITSGILVPCAHRLSRRLQRRGVCTKVFDCFALPLQEDRFLHELSGVRAVACLEDGRLGGGLGSLVLEILSDAGLLLPVKRLGLRIPGGLPPVFCSREMIHRREGLDEEQLYAQISAFYQTARAGEGGGKRHDE